MSVLKLSLTWRASTQIALHFWSFLRQPSFLASARHKKQKFKGMNKSLRPQFIRFLHFRLGNISLRNICCWNLTSSSHNRRAKWLLIYIDIDLARLSKGGKVHIRHFFYAKNRSHFTTRWSKLSVELRYMEWHAFMS